MLGSTDNNKQNEFERLNFDPTALHTAAFFGITSVALRLIAYGADIETLNSKGLTALEIAYEKGHREVVHILVNATENYWLRWSRKLWYGVGIFPGEQVLPQISAMTQEEKNDRAAKMQQQNLITQRPAVIYTNSTLGQNAPSNDSISRSSSAPELKRLSFL